MTFRLLLVTLCLAGGDSDIPLEIITRTPATDTNFHLNSTKRVSGELNDGAVLTVGAQGSFDSAWIGTPDVDFDGKLYRMWYAGSPVLPMYTGEAVSIGLATSTDGIHWRRANDGKPVLEPGSLGAFDDAQVMGPCVLHHDAIWKMWYCGLGHPKDLKDRNDTKQWEVRLRIGFAISSDGIHWQRENDGQPVLDLGAEGSTGDVQIMHPSVLRDGDGYRMWYASNSKKLPHSLGMATSKDGIHWEKYRDGAPLEGLGHYITGPAVYRRGDEYLMLYSREDLEANVWVIDAAVSTDCFHWKVLNKGKPVADPGPGPARELTVSPQEEGSAFHPSALVLNDSTARFWYVENFSAGKGGYRMALGELMIGRRD